MKQNQNFKNTTEINVKKKRILIKKKENLVKVMQPDRLCILNEIISISDEEPSEEEEVDDNEYDTIYDEYIFPRTQSGTCYL